LKSQVLARFWAKTQVNRQAGGVVFRGDIQELRLETDRIAAKIQRFFWAEIKI